MAALAKDAQYLTTFVDGLENGFMLRENLYELQQTINLLQSDNHEEFFDIQVRNKKYDRINALNGQVLLEKSVHPVCRRASRTKLTSNRLAAAQNAGRTAAALANFSSRFGIR